jgi:hypothetical protein
MFMWEHKKVEFCAVCSSGLEELWFLPKPPFTERYGLYDPKHQYTQFMRSLAKKLTTLRGMVYGYGANLMLATLAYHLKTGL